MKYPIEKMRRCLPLLPPPGGEVVAECLDEIESLRQQLDAANTLINKYREETTSLHQQVKLLSDFVTKISEQLPEKPDHWSSCSQCEYNSSDAQDIIEALAATAPKEELK